MAALWQNCSMPKDPIEALRQLCLALPETTERLSHGEPAWFVRGKRVFVTYADHWHQIADLVADAYRAVAPKHLLAALDAREGG